MFKALAKYTPFFVIIMFYPAISQWLDYSVQINGPIMYSYSALLLLSFVGAGKISRVSSLPWTMKLYGTLLFLSAIYGFSKIELNFDLHALISNFFAFALFLVFFYVYEPLNLALMNRKLISFSIFVFWLLLPIMQLQCVGQFLAPFSFLLLFFPYYSRRGKVIVLVFSLLVLLVGSLGARATALRFCVSFAFALLLILNRPFVKLLKWMCLSFYIMPILLLLLGVLGVFNIFNIQENLGLQNVEVSETFDKDNKEDLTSDTRTFIYYEVLSSAINNDYQWFGNSLARGYETKYFTNSDIIASRGERYASEVAILNVFTYMGLIGAFLYTLIFTTATYNVFRKSKNKPMLIVGTYVAFRWLFSFVEDFQRLDYVNLYLWIAIAMCYSPKYLEMTDKEFRTWVQNLV